MSSDEIAERALKKGRHRSDPYSNSIDPPGLEGTGLGKNEEETRNIEDGEENEDPIGPAGSEFYDISSDKEEDTTEGEITDTETSV